MVLIRIQPRSSIGNGLNWMDVNHMLTFFTFYSNLGLCHVLIITLPWVQINFVLIVFDETKENNGQCMGINFYATKRFGSMHGLLFSFLVY